LCDRRLVAVLLVGGLLAAATGGAFAQLAAGDVAIVGFWSDSTPSPKAFAYVPLRNIPEGTVISFTDDGWFAAGGFRATEGVVTYTAPAGGLTAGTVVTLAGDAGLFNLSTSGDQVFAFQGAISSPILLYGYQDNGATWDADATSANTSALPPALLVANVAMSAELDNYAYTGVTSGSGVALLAAISDASNWSGSDAAQPAFPASFTVTSASASSPLPISTGVVRVVPNPFNPRTTIKCDLPAAGSVRLSVFDLAGRLVRTLVDENKAQGSFEAVWDGRDSSGREVGSGTYLARLEFEGKVEVVRMGLVR